MPRECLSFRLSGLQPINHVSSHLTYTLVPSTNVTIISTDNFVFIGYCSHLLPQQRFHPFNSKANTAKEAKQNLSLTI